MATEVCFSPDPWFFRSLSTQAGVIESLAEPLALL